MERNNLRSLWEQRLAEYEDSGNTIKAWCQERISDVIVSNRFSDELLDVEEKVYTRDLYGRD